MKPKVQVLRGRIRVIFSFFFTYYFFISTQIVAQTIPDASFAEAIRVVCPTCIDASNKLLPPAAALTSLDVSAKGIADLTGIGGFTTLKTLNCQNNRLTQLPTLPGTLTTLLCDVNQITTLPALPEGLNALSCNYNQLAFLPVLPSQLQAITCNNNQLVQLPALPKTLMALSCTNNLLTALPELPEKLQLLFCTDNKITQLPALPDGLTTVYCHDNPISCLPYLPNSLSVLYIDTDKVGCLPNTVPELKVYNVRGNLVDNFPVCVFIQDPKFAEAIRSNCPSCIGTCNNLTPNAALQTSLNVSNRGITSLSGIENFTSLQRLECSYNALTALPSNLPKTLSYLECGNNVITALPVLPNQLVSLSCSYNRLSNIDNLPPNLTRLDCNNNALTTLPKLPATLTLLSCQANQLLSLPELPGELTQFIASNNQLSTLPTLPSKLRSIEVNNNRLTSLPALPPQLSYLYCANNTPLTCLPLLPNSLNGLNINNTQITCLPNQVKNLYVSNSAGYQVPVCGLSDPEFQKAIQGICPSCVDDCFKIKPTEMAKVTSLNLSGKNITNLSGIELFSALQSLNIANNPLIACLPILPPSLTSLTIDADKITCFSNSNPNLKVYNATGQLIPTPPACVGFIPDANFAQSIRSACPTCIDICNNLLPPAATLQQLQIYAQNITDLTGIEQFKNLKTFYCYNSPLTGLPPLPPVLERLVWLNGQLKVLSNLPGTIVTLDCYNNKIEQIGTLPSGLQNLNISSNRLQALSLLPNTLTYLNVANNKIGTISQLPDNLLELICENNELTTLPSLPKKIGRLACAINNLAKLPELPTMLTYIDCSTNRLLTCLPVLPSGLRQLYIYGNSGLSCLPNFPSGMSVSGSSSASLPLCGVADINLAQAIKEACPACLNECFTLFPAEVEKVTSLNLAGKNINNLVGLEAFSGLQSLNISGNSLVCIPYLPKTLTSLTIDADKITCLPIQNPNLKVYNAAGEPIPTPKLCSGHIVDVNFAKAIRGICPGCIDNCNNLLPEALEIETLSIESKSIKDLTGIEGFKYLKTLSCSGNQLTEFPALPKGLIYLYCSNNTLKTISNLPNTLTKLWCTGNSITKIDSLPSSLIELYCSSNLLTLLPPLPGSLQILSCGSNNLTKLPALPSTLTSVDCSGNTDIGCLPTLPKNLQSLSIYGNNKIKCLPNSVKGLYIYGNNSEPLPICSVSDVNFLQAIQEACPTCLDECLKLVPAEVAKISSLNLSGKNIVSLAGFEAFSTLQSLNIANNSLVCIPFLPQTLTSLTIDADKITCLPAYNPNLKVYNAAGQPITAPINCTGFIRDVNFAKAIRSNCSNCLDDCNNLLPPAQQLQSLYISSYKITDLTGIEGFTNLQTLYCQNNNLTILPKLPSKLIFLDCSSNQLKQMAEMPETLKTLQATNNQLTQLPNLPEALQSLNCANNQLIQLPNLLGILQSLNCENNQLTQLPKLPETLQSVRCCNNQITCLSYLPASITYLQFDSNKIGCLPNIRTSVTLYNQNSQQLINYTECSNPIILSDITASSPNPIISGGNVTFTIKRNYTGTVSIKWQRKKANESDFSDFTPATTLYGVNNDLTYTLSQLALTDNGNSYRAAVSSACLGTFFSKAITLEVKDLALATPTIISSPRDTVCVGQTVQLSTSCAAGASVEWSTGATSASIAVTSIQPASRSYTAKCVLGSEKTDSSPAKVIVWKPLEVTLINIGQSQSGVKPGVSVPMSAWNNQFVTPDAGPDLQTSTQANPTIYYIENSNKTTPRYWTAHVDACDLPATGSISYDMLATPEVGAPMSFNTHENSAPYLMYANRDGFTELYAQNNVFFGFYEKDNTGQNRYDAGLPKGLYKLSIRYWNQKGNGLAPAVRAPQGSQLSYQEHWFRIQSQAGVGSGAARTAFNNDQLSDRRTAVNNDQWAEVSPNPVSKTLRLNVNDAKGESVNVSLVDAWGRTLLQRIFVPETNRHQEEFEVSDKAAGMYLMRVNSSTKQAVLKVIKTE